MSWLAPAGECALICLILTRSGRSQAGSKTHLGYRGLGGVGWIMKHEVRSLDRLNTINDSPKKKKA